MEEETKTCSCGTGSCAVHGGMRKWMMFGIAAIVIVLIWFMVSDRGGEEESISEKMMKNEVMAPAAEEEEAESVVTNQSEDAMMKKTGAYEAYDASKLRAAEEGKVVLFFRASWCPSCRALDADIRKNVSSIPVGVTILDVDYDQYADLKKQYGITTQHTLVSVDESGKELGKWVGSATLSELVTKIK